MFQHGPITHRAIDLRRITALTGLALRGHSQKIADPKQFQAFLQQQGDATLEELAEAWVGGSG